MSLIEGHRARKTHGRDPSPGGRAVVDAAIVESEVKGTLQPNDAKVLDENSIRSSDGEI